MCELRERVVERRDLGPVRFLCRARSRMAGRYRRLQRIWPERAAERLRAFERREPATDEELVPLPAVLIEKEDGLAGRSHARPRARRLDLHEGNEAMGLRLAPAQIRDEAAEAKRIQAKCRSPPVGGHGLRQ